MSGYWIFWVDDCGIPQTDYCRDKDELLRYTDFPRFTKGENHILKIIQGQSINFKEEIIKKRIIIPDQ